MTVEFRIQNENEPTKIDLPPSPEKQRPSFMVEEVDDDGPLVSDESDVEEIFPSKLSPAPVPKPKVEKQPPPFKPFNKEKPKFDHRFSNFMNPDKGDAPPEESDVGSDEEESVFSDASSQLSSIASVNQSNMQPSSTPSQSFNQADRKREKQKEYYQKKSLLNELKELERKGYKLYDHYTIKDRIEDIKHEVLLGNRYFNIIRGQEFISTQIFHFARMLETFTETLPILIEKFPFLSYFSFLKHIKLKGLHDGLAKEKDSIDHDVRRIIKKYTGEDGEAIPPEVSLFCTVIGAIITTISLNQGADFLATQADKYIGDNAELRNGITGMLNMGMEMFKNFDVNPMNNILPNEVKGPAQPFLSQQNITQQQTMAPPTISQDLENLFPKQNPPPSSPGNNFDVLPPPVNTRPQPGQLREEMKEREKQFQPKSKIDSSDRFSELSSVISSDSGNSKGSDRRRRKGRKTLDIF